VPTLTQKGIGFVPDVYPGFSNTGNEGRNLPWKVIPQDVSNFSQMLQFAINNASSEPGYVMVGSWNEWVECPD